MTIELAVKCDFPGCTRKSIMYTSLDEIDARAVSAHYGWTSRTDRERVYTTTLDYCKEHSDDSPHRSGG